MARRVHCHALKFHQEKSPEVLVDVLQAADQTTGPASKIRIDIRHQADNVVK